MSKFRTFQVAIGWASALAAALVCGPAAAQSLPDLAPTMTKKLMNVADEAEKAVDVRLIAEGTALVPGRSTTIGVSFDIAAGWNLYWRNCGDSGLPISVKFEAPEGVTVGEAQWPTPERHVLPGDLLDYVYMRRVTLLFPVSVSSSLEASSGVTIKATARWLVCKEACVPGERAIELRLPVASGSSAGADAALIQSSRDRLPLSESEQSSPIINAAWSGRTLRVSCAGAEELIFFPYEGDAQPNDALKNGRSKSGVLGVSYPDAEAGAAVTGVVEVRRLGRTTYHLLQAPAVPAE